MFTLFYSVWNVFIHNSGTHLSIT